MSANSSKFTDNNLGKVAQAEKFLHLSTPRAINWSRKSGVRGCFGDDGVVKKSRVGVEMGWVGAKMRDNPIESGGGLSKGEIKPGERVA